MRPPTIRRGGPLPSEVPELTCSITASGHLLRPSRAFQALVGLTAETLGGRPLLDFIHPGDRSSVEGALVWLENNEGPIVFEARWRHADGSYRWLEWTVRGGARDGTLRAGLRDVTPWKQDEALALAHVRVLEAIVLGLPLEEVFGHLASLLEALGVDLQPAVHLLDPASNALVLVAGAAFPEGFRRALESLPLPDGPGAAVAAARDKQFIVSADLGRETHWRGRRELPLLHGIRAEWAHPVIDGDGKLLGTVTAFLPQPGAPRPRDRQILALAAQLVATALGRFRAVDGTRHDVEQVRAELKVLEQQRAHDLEAWESRLAAERSDWTDRLQKAEASARLANDSLLQARAEDGSARAETERKLDELQEALDEAQRRVDQLTLHKEELEGRVVEAEVAQELLHGDLEQLQADAESKQGHSAELKRRLAEAELVREGLQREIDTAREAVAERNALEAKLAQASAERDALEQRLGDLATLLADARMAAASVTPGPSGEEIETLRRHLRESEAAREVLETGLAELRRSAQSADAELRTLGMRMGEFDAQRESLEQQLAAMRERVDAAEQRRGEAEARLGAGRQALEDVIPLRSQLAESERRRAELEAVLAATEPVVRRVTSSDVDEDLAALHARLAVSEAERRRLEAELAEARPAAAEAMASAPAATLLRALFEGSAAPMVAVDANGAVTFWNRTAALLLGRSESEVLGRELASVTGESADEHRDTAGAVHGAERRTWRRPDGTAVPLMVSSVPLPATAPDRPLTLLVALPAGEESDAHRLRPLSSLDHLPGLAGGIARQVAELLAEIVAGTSQARAPRGRSAQKPLEAIEYVARRASDLVRHLVVCAGEEIVEGDLLDLTELVDRLRGELAAMLPPGLELHFRLTPHLAPMVGDASQLRQVIAQLVTNSAEALEGRRGVISVATGLVDADRQYLSRAYFDDGLPEGRYLFLEVSDTGSGMDAEALAHLFEPHFSTKGPARGLGLALVLGIVRAHHGALQVYSKPDVGTTVRLLLPTAAGARHRHADGSHPPSVLLLDRDRTVRGTAARILERWGFGVVEAANVREGAEVLRQQPSVQLVVLEAGLSADEGPAAELLRGVRGDVQLLIAGEPNGTGNGEHALSVVSRPFAPVELVAAVRAALGTRTS
jgi:PAS domain S-box-containing protein